MKPAIGVLALQGDVPEHLRALEAAGARPAPVRRPEELDRLDGLVIPGGESTTLWRLSVAFDVLEPLRKLIGEGLPAFGSCAGMIMLADRRGPRASGLERAQVLGHVALQGEHADDGFHCPSGLWRTQRKPERRGFQGRAAQACWGFIGLKHRGSGLFFPRRGLGRPVGGYQPREA